MSYSIHTDFENRQEWSQFVKNHPNGNIFQTPEIVDLYRSYNLITPISIACKNSDGTLVGILVAAIQKEHSGIAGILSSRSIIWGGPLVHPNHPQAFSLILDAYEKLISSKAIYTQFRNLWNLSEQESSILASKNYVYEEHLNILVDLTKTEDQLWKELHSKRRNEIRKAIKERLTVREIKSDEETLAAYNILKEVYDNARLPLYTKSFFLSASKILNKSAGIKVFGAFSDTKLVGTMIVLCYQNRIYDWYAGSLRSFYHKNPNDLIPWEVFKWAKANGFSQFDFGGAGKPDKKYGVRDYKIKFGGELINPGRFEKIHQKKLFAFAKFGFSIWQKLKKIR